MWEATWSIHTVVSWSDDAPQKDIQTVPILSPPPLTLHWRCTSPMTLLLTPTLPCFSSLAASDWMAAPLRSTPPLTCTWSPRLQHCRSALPRMSSWLPQPGLASARSDFLSVWTTLLNGGNHLSPALDTHYQREVPEPSLQFPYAAPHLHREGNQ